MIVCLASLLLAAPTSGASGTPLMGAAQIDEVVLLDVNARYAALRLLERGVEETGSEMCSYKPVPCRYPGLPSPHSGVTLYLVDFNTNKLIPFAVNPTGRKGCDERRRCLSHAKAKRRLRAAKRAFRQAGLNIAKRPKPTLSISWPHKPTKHTIEEPENPEDIDPSEEVIGRKSIEQKVRWGGRDFLLRSVDTTGLMEGTIVNEILEGDKVWYRSKRTYGTHWAGAGNVRFPQAYETPHGLVFLERVEHTGGSTYLHYTVTPPIPAAATKPAAIDCPRDPVAMVKAVYATYTAERPPALGAITCWTQTTRQLISSRQLAFDPVVQAQDYQLSKVQIKALKDGSVEAKFVNIRTPMTVVWTFERSDRWRVVDLVHKGTSLVKTLQAQPPVR